MSDSVKLIIEMPKETYKSITADEYAIYDKMYYSIKNGTPLDDVKAEIANINTFERAGCWVMEDVWKVLDNIGKESEDT